MKIVVRLFVEIVGGPNCGCKINWLSEMEESLLMSLALVKHCGRYYAVTDLDIQRMTAKFHYYTPQ